jgi:hypothetical protein
MFQYFKALMVWCHKKVADLLLFLYNNIMESVIVESYAGSRAEEYPLRFHYSGRTIEIVSIIKRWLTSESRNFTVLGDDGNKYELEYRNNTAQWNLLAVNRP